MATGFGRSRGEPSSVAGTGDDRIEPLAARAVRGRRLSILAIAAVVVAADQVTKTWALHHAQNPVHVLWTLQFEVTFNSGTAFGLGQGSTALIIGGVVVLLVVLLGLGRRASRNASWPAVMAMGLLLGGAMGNLADRLVRHHHGAVIDFIDLRWWPVFNVADASITVGAALLALVLFRARPAGPPPSPGGPRND
jgi:signal peptidase II